MKKLLAIIFVFVCTILYSQSCPDSITGDVTNGNILEDIILYDIEGNAIDTIVCTLSNNGGNNYEVDCDLSGYGSDVYYEFNVCNGNNQNNCVDCLYDSDGNNIDGNLPVELINYETAYRDGTVVLNWSTGSERNNSHFIIERSYDGYNWDNIYYIDGQGTTSERTDYEQTDEPEPGTVYYRLIQYDYDGVFSIEGIRSIVVEKRKILKIINLLGQEVTNDYDGIKIIIYSNGDQEKIY